MKRVHFIGGRSGAAKRRPLAGTLGIKGELTAVIIILRLLAVFAMAYNAWIIFRVVDDWFGLIAAIISVVAFPVSITVMPFVMLFIPSSAAGPLALWPAILFVVALGWVAKKLGGSLLIK